MSPGAGFCLHTADWISTFMVTYGDHVTRLIFFIVFSCCVFWSLNMLNVFANCVWNMLQQPPCCWPHPVLNWKTAGCSCWHFQQEWDTFEMLPTKMRCLYYWWEPDTTFLSLKGKEISYSPHDAAAVARGDTRSSAKGLSIDTWTWWLHVAAKNCFCLFFWSQRFLKHLFGEVYISNFFEDLW